MVERRVTNGRLVPLHRGVYAVGHRQLRREGHWLAAVLAVPGSVLSHRDAAGLHELRPANHARVDVTGIEARGGRAGITVHRTTILGGQDRTTVRGIPVTTVARTLVDLAGVVPREQLAKAFRRADELRALDSRAVNDVLARTRHRRGIGHKATSAALAELQALATTLTRSSLEVSFQRLIRQARLPKPQTNVHIGDHEVDTCWPHAKLIVELDGWQSHGTKHAFQNDRERDVAATKQGWTVVRFTHHDVAHRSMHVAETMRELLTAR